MISYKLWTVDHGHFKVQQFAGESKWTVYFDTDTTDCCAWSLLPQQMRELIDVLKKTTDIIQEDHEASLGNEQ